MGQTKIFGKLAHKSEFSNMWRASRWPFVGTILQKGPDCYSWRLKLHESFQSTDILQEDSADTLEAAQDFLDQAAKRHVRALSWFLQ